MKKLVKQFVNSEYWKEQKSKKSAVYVLLHALNKVYSTSSPSRLASEVVRLWYYKKFRLGYKIIRIKYGSITCQFEAISPKNLWHIAIGSQHENKFLPKLFDKYIKLGDVCLDIGGHTGMYTIPLALRVGEKGRVFVFEPELSGYKAILRNLSLNNLSNVQVFNMAIGNKDTVVPFYIRPDKDTHSIYEISPATMPKGQFSTQVKMSRIDTLVKGKKIPTPNFIKVDVEGAELEVIRGFGDVAISVRAILVEIHKDALKLLGVLDPHSELITELRGKGFGKFEYMDGIHLLARK